MCDTPVGTTRGSPAKIERIWCIQGPEGVLSQKYAILFYTDWNISPFATSKRLSLCHEDVVMVWAIYNPLKRHQKQEENVVFCQYIPNLKSQKVYRFSLIFLLNKKLVLVLKHFTTFLRADKAQLRKQL